MLTMALSPETAASRPTSGSAKAVSLSARALSWGEELKPNWATSAFSRALTTSSAATPQPRAGLMRRVNCNWTMRSASTPHQGANNGLAAYATRLLFGRHAGREAEKHVERPTPWLGGDCD